MQLGQLNGCARGTETDSYNVQVLTEVVACEQRGPPNHSAKPPRRPSLFPPCKPPAIRHSMTSRQAKLQEDTYFRVMRILQDNPDLTQRELAEKLGISVGGLNYCLKALMEKGLVKMKNFANSKNKFGYVYVLTPSGMAEKAAITHRFLQRKLEEYELLKAEIEVLKSEVTITTDNHHGAQSA
ncbi:MarR family EPS-associated transcriptional regulator [Piscinibacterium candidicorallinum]